MALLFGIEIRYNKRYDSVTIYEIILYLFPDGQV